MFNHAKEDYFCPLCSLISGKDNERVYSKQTDIVYKDDFVTAFIASHPLKNNPGLVMIVPNKHYENLYDMPDDILARVHQLSKRVSIAIRNVFPNCKGNVLRQHNEPVEEAKCKGQDVLHYHLHIMPRYSDDKMYEYVEDGERWMMPQEERKHYADLLRQELSE